MIVKLTILDMDMIDSVMIQAGAAWWSSSTCARLDEVALQVDRFPDGIVKEPADIRRRFPVEFSSAERDNILNALLAHDFGDDPHGNGYRRQQSLVKMLRGESTPERATGLPRGMGSYAGRSLESLLRLQGTTEGVSRNVA